MTHQTVLSVDDVTQADQATLKRLDIDAFMLVDRVAKALFEQFKQLGYLKQKPNVLVMAGPGNNGADGLMFAHYLKQHLPVVTTVFIGDETHASLPVKQALKTLDDVVKIDPTQTLKAIPKQLTHEIVIDALFGIHLNRPLDGVYQAAVNHINALNCHVISIDIPTGVNASNGLAYPDTIKADETYVIYPYKPGTFMQDAPDYHGNIYAIDVGIKPHQQTVFQTVLPLHKATLKKRRLNTHKYDYGMALIIGGHKGMEGAPYLSAKAALSSGTGLVTIAYDSTAELIPPSTPEIQKHRTNDVEEVYHMLQKVDVIVFGVGLSRENDDYKALLKHCIQLKKHIVVDADGLHYLKPWLHSTLDMSRVVITPHMGELAHLFDVSSKTVKTDPLNYMKQLTDQGLTVLLKGVTNIIAHQNQRYYIPVKLPALAKAGSGDVLSGIVATFIKQTPHDLPHALIQAVMLQTHATKHVLKTKHEATILPTDIINALSSGLNVLK